MKIGVVGYSSGKFDPEQAKKLVDLGLNYYKNKYGTLEIVSGLTNVGIPALAYQWAKENGFKTVGIACGKATEYDCFPVDKKYIVGKEWGDESEKFINYVDTILRVGGGPQSLAEVKAFRELKPNTLILELDLAREE